MRPMSSIRITAHHVDAAPAPGREIVEVLADGVRRWQVEEMSCDDHPGALARLCLVFTSDMMMRRVYDYPADWRSLTNAELLALSWRR
jgi:hypothetical protein